MELAPSYLEQLKPAAATVPDFLSRLGTVLQWLGAVCDRANTHYCHANSRVLKFTSLLVVGGEGWRVRGRG